MANPQLKEAIADYGIEETLEAMIELIDDRYLVGVSSLFRIGMLRKNLSDLLTYWQESSNEKTRSFIIR